MCAALDFMKLLSHATLVAVDIAGFALDSHRDHFFVHAK